MTPHDSAYGWTYDCDLLQQKKKGKAKISKGFEKVHMAKSGEPRRKLSRPSPSGVTLHVLN